MYPVFPLILDGATGTELQKRGFSGPECTEQWVLEHPEEFISMQKEYVDVGSKIVYSPTFGGNRTKLEEHGIFSQTREYNKKLAGLSKKAADGKAWVAGDIAPTGLFLAPMGDTSFEELYEIYSEQVDGLLEAGVDLFVIETMMTLPEARAAVLAVKAHCDKPVFCTFTCDANGKTLSGTDVTAALVVMQGMGVDAFGLNCSVGPEDMLRQITRLREYAEVPLIAKPNAGMPKTVGGKTVYDLSPEELAGFMAEFAGQGVAIFGGCCGTHSGHISALNEKSASVCPAEPAPEHTGLLPCASEKRPCYLPADIELGKTVKCSDDMADELEEAMENELPVICVSIETEDELELFADCQYMIDCALCFKCSDAALLEKALRLYQGRAMYEGTLSDEELLPLVSRYGLVI